MRQFITKFIIMKRESKGAIIFLLLISLIASAPLLTYDPTAGSATVTLLSKDSNSFKWLYKRFASSVYSIESVSLDIASSNPTNKVATVTYNAGADDFSLKAISPSHDCALLVQGTSKLVLVKFNANNALQ